MLQASWTELNRELAVPDVLTGILYARILIMFLLAISGLLLFLLGFYLVTKGYTSPFKAELEGSKFEANSPGLAFLVAGSFLMWLAAQTTLTYWQGAENDGSPATEAPSPPSSDSAPAAVGNAQGASEAPVVPGAAVADAAPSATSTRPAPASERRRVPPLEVTSDQSIFIRFVEGSPVTPESLSEAVRVAIEALDQLHDAASGPTAPEDRGRYRAAMNVFRSMRVGPAGGGTNGGD